MQLEQSAEAPFAGDLAATAFLPRIDESVVDTLVVAFSMVVSRNVRFFELIWFLTTLDPPICSIRPGKYEKLNRAYQSVSGQSM